MVPSYQPLLQMLDDEHCSSIRITSLIEKDYLY